MIAVIIGMELVGPSRRRIAAIVPGICFAFGEIMLGGLAYLIRDYRILQMVVALPGILFLPFWW